jgi:signal transduction histidine kinase
LHDEIIPTLSNTLRSVEVNIIDFENGKGSIDKLKKDALEMNHSIVRIRGISHDLAPPELLKFGVFAALKHYLKRIEDGGDYQTDFEDTTAFGEKLPFTISEQLNIYRLCLEIINNLNKHTAYSYLKATIETQTMNLIIDFTHDGKGIENKEIDILTESSMGLGLKSLKSRALLLNAIINYSFDDELANVKITIPYKA